MSSCFSILTQNDADTCVDAIKHFSLDFGLDTFESSLFVTAVSEALVNALRYAHACEVDVHYTTNGLGIEIDIEDNGQGIKDLDIHLEDGYTTRPSSLGLGFGVMQRCSDEFLIVKNDENGLSLRLRKYKNIVLYDSAELSVAKEGEDFNGDSSFILRYDGDKVLHAVLDGAGHGIKAHKSVEFVKEILLQNYRMPLDALVEKCHEALNKTDLSRSVELALLRFEVDKLEYLLLGNLFIRSYPYKPFLGTNGSIGLSLPLGMQVLQHTLDDNFCISICSDGIDKEMNLYETYNDISAKRLSVEIHNKYNLDDDSSVIVIKR